MPARKITIETTEDNLIKVLKELKVATINYKDHVFVTLDLPDDKFTYEYLSKSEDVENWSLGAFNEFDESRFNPTTNKKKKSASKKETETEEVVEKIEQPRESVPKPKKFTQYTLDFIKFDEGYEGLAKFIEASWRVCKKSSGIIFGTPLFKSVLEKEYELIEKEGNKIDRALLRQVLETYYMGYPFEDAVEDAIEKIRSAWKSLPTHQSLTSVSIRLYKNT